MISNFHTHTYRCLHAYGKEIDYVDAALKADMQILGFSDHGPFPDKDFGLRMQFSELRDYLGEIESLSVKFKDRLKIYKGLEIEYHPRYVGYYKQLLSDFGLDYLLLGEHQYTATDGNIKNIFFAESTADYIEYAENIAEASQSGLFKAIAHPDVMFINEHTWDKNCAKACDIILSAAEEYDIILEYNANGLRRGRKPYADGKRFPYPHENFWRQLSGSRQRVMIGSDCHSPDQLDDAVMTLAEKNCSELKLNVINNIMEE